MATNIQKITCYKARLINKEGLNPKLKMLGDKEWLKEQYKIKNAYLIAKELNCNNQQVYYWMQKFKIKRRTKKEINNNYYEIVSLFNNKERLYQKYISEKLSPKEVAQIADCSAATIRKRLFRFNIKVRSLSEASKGLRVKEKAGGWKGGRINNLDYILLHNPEHPFASIRGYVREHRLVMENRLRKTNPNHPALIEIAGEKYLRKGYQVHHINGIREDNRADNLELCIRGKNHPPGQRNEDLQEQIRKLLKENAEFKRRKVCTCCGGIK